MTATPALALTAAERRTVDRFDAAPYPVEVAEAALVETVARALWDACNGEGSHLSWDDKRVSEPYKRRHRAHAVAAIAAYRGQVGATCGDVAPTIVPGPRLMCELPHGHGGAHQHDNGDGLPPTRWIAAQDGGADGRECDRCDGTGEQPDPDPHDERFYRCTVCNGSGIAPLPQEKDGGAEEAVRRVRDGIDSLLRNRDHIRPVDLWWSLGELRAALATQAGDGAR